MRSHYKSFTLVAVIALFCLAESRVEKLQLESDFDGVHNSDKTSLVFITKSDCAVCEKKMEAFRESAFRLREVAKFYEINCDEFEDGEIATALCNE